MLAGLIMTLSTGAALATGMLKQLHEVLPPSVDAIDAPEVVPSKPGKPRTILVLGSDARYDDEESGLKPRSDTILLVRADPRTQTISAMSIPRDLEATSTATTSTT